MVNLIASTVDPGLDWQEARPTNSRASRSYQWVTHGCLPVLPLHSSPDEGGEICEHTRYLSSSGGYFSCTLEQLQGSFEIFLHEDAQHPPF